MPAGQKPGLPSDQRIRATQVEVDNDARASQATASGEAGPEQTYKWSAVSPAYFRTLGIPLLKGSSPATGRGVRP